MQPTSGKALYSCPTFCIPLLSTAPSLTIIIIALNDYIYSTVGIIGSVNFKAKITISTKAKDEMNDSSKKITKPMSLN